MTTTDTTPTRSIRTRAAAAAVLLALVLGGLAYALGGSDDGPADPTLADGKHVVVMRVGTDGQVKLDVVEVLTGKQAVDAAHEDGELDPNEDSLPNDVYVRNLDELWVPATISDGATVALFDCTAECNLAPVELDDFVDGTATPFNGEHAIYDIEVADGEVVSFAEIYLP